jgi:integrase
MKVTLKERAAGHWRLRLEVGKDASGKRLFKYETVKGTREDAERRRFEILHAHEEGSYALTDKITLGAFFARWIETRRALNKIRRSTTENYACIFNTHIAPTLASSRLQSITGADIQNPLCAACWSLVSEHACARASRHGGTLPRRAQGQSAQSQPNG